MLLKLGLALGYLRGGRIIFFKPTNCWHFENGNTSVTYFDAVRLWVKGPQFLTTGFLD